MLRALFIKNFRITKFPWKTISFKENSIQLVNGSKLFNLFELRIEFVHRLVVCFIFCANEFVSLSFCLFYVSINFVSGKIQFHLMQQSIKTQNETAESIKFSVKLIWYRNEHLAHNKKVLCRNFSNVSKIPSLEKSKWRQTLCQNILANWIAKHGQTKKP